MQVLCLRGAEGLARPPAAATAAGCACTSGHSRVAALASKVLETALKAAPALLLLLEHGLLLLLVVCVLLGRLRALLLSLLEQACAALLLHQAAEPADGGFSRQLLGLFACLLGGCCAAGGRCLNSCGGAAEGRLQERTGQQAGGRVVGRCTVRRPQPGSLQAMQTLLSKPSKTGLEGAQGRHSCWEAAAHLVQGCCCCLLLAVQSLGSHPPHGSWQLDRICRVVLET